jgi:hypothetical protein
VTQKSGVVKWTLSDPSAGGLRHLRRGTPWLINLAGFVSTSRLLESQNSWNLETLAPGCLRPCWRKHSQSVCSSTASRSRLDLRAAALLIWVQPLEGARRTTNFTSQFHPKFIGRRRQIPRVASPDSAHDAILLCDSQPWCHLVWRVASIQFSCCKERMCRGVS